MYIVLFTHKDHAMMKKMQSALKDAFPFLQFTMKEIESSDGVKHQIRLEGSASEDKPMSFAKGFAAAWANGCA